MAISSGHYRIGEQFRKPMFLITALAISGSVGYAADSDVEIHCVPKKLDETVNQAASAGGTARAKEHWVYDVTIENKTFKDLVGVEVKYIIFFKQEKQGVKAEATPRRQTGSMTINLLAPHEKKSFTTTAVELNKSHLVGRYHYRSGGKLSAQDTLEGLWIRLYQNGQQFAEYANPSTLAKEPWQ
jgi:hypothetical protein